MEKEKEEKSLLNLYTKNEKYIQTLQKIMQKIRT
jgi:hypothetical protein